MARLTDLDGRARGSALQSNTTKGERDSRRPQSRTATAIRHVDIVVSSLDVSLPFYLDFLKPLGWRRRRQVVGERGEPILYIAGPGGFATGAVGLREQQSERRSGPYDRYAVGLHHVAFNAPSAEHVSACAERLRSHGVTIESGPEYYYDIEYFAVFFYDPDGIKLEVVHMP